MPLKKLHEKPKPRLSPSEHWRKGCWTRSSSGIPGKPLEQSLPHAPHPCSLASPFSPCRSAAETSNVLGWRGSGHPLLLSRSSVGFGTCLGHTFLLALLALSPPLHAQPSQPSLPIYVPTAHPHARIWGQEQLRKSQTDGCQQPPATWSKLLILPPPSSPVVWVRRVCVGMGGPRGVLRGLQAAGPQSYGRAFVSFPSEKAPSMLRYHLAIYTVLLYINCAAGEGMNHTCSTRAARAPAQPQPAPLQPAPSSGPCAALR